MKLITFTTLGRRIKIVSASAVELHQGTLIIIGGRLYFPDDVVEIQPQPFELAA